MEVIRQQVSKRTHEPLILIKRNRPDESDKIMSDSILDRVLISEEDKHVETGPAVARD